VKKSASKNGIVKRVDFKIDLNAVLTRKVLPKAKIWLRCYGFISLSL